MGSSSWKRRTVADVESSAAVMNVDGVADEVGLGEMRGVEPPANDEGYESGDSAEGAVTDC